MKRYHDIEFEEIRNKQFFGRKKNYGATIVSPDGQVNKHFVVIYRFTYPDRGPIVINMQLFPEDENDAYEWACQQIERNIENDRLQSIERDQGSQP